MTVAASIMLGAVAGLIMGSFLATLAVRWPQGRTLAGRSACDGCGAVLRVHELVPLLSYVAFRGRCRWCGTAIDARHPLVELTCAGVGAVAMAMEPSWQGATGAVFGWLLVALATLDATDFWLPDRLTATLAVTGIATGFIGIDPDLHSRVIGGASAFAALWLIAFGYRRTRGREGLGGGDPKLFGAIGLWLGWAALPFVLLGASVAGLVFALAMRLRGKQVAADTRLPFGSFLALAAFPVWLLSR